MNEGLIIQDEYLLNEHIFVENLQILTTTGTVVAQYEF